VPFNKIMGMELTSDGMPDANSWCVWFTLCWAKIGRFLGLERNNPYQLQQIIKVSHCIPSSEAPREFGVKVRENSITMFFLTHWTLQRLLQF
jgi:hypothetical protein